MTLWRAIILTGTVLVAKRSVPATGGPARQLTSGPRDSSAKWEETDEVSRSGKLVHRVERLDHMLAWFDKYLMGQETHAYEVN